MHGERERSANAARWCAVGLFLATWAVHAACPEVTSFDSRWTVPIAVSLLERGDANIDEYSGLFEQERYAGVECVSREGVVRRGPPVRCNGHFYSQYPVAVPVLAAPLVWMVDRCLQMASPVTRPFTDPGRHPAREAFFRRDLIAGRAVVELVLASLLVALTATVVFAIALEYLPPLPALAPAVVLAFGTSAWSTGSRALWQHGPSMLMLAVALLLLVRSRRRPGIAPWIALPLALAYTVRPTNAIPVAAITVLVLVRYPRSMPRFLLIAAPVAALFFGYNAAIYHRAFPPYYSMRPQAPTTAAAGASFLKALAGNLVSPSRGLFVFTPVLLAAVYGMWLALRTRWNGGLSVCIAAILAAHWVTISLYTGFWWAGHSYGPRLFTDMLPFLCFFLIPAIGRWRERGARRVPAVLFALLLCFSAAVHGRAAVSTAVWRWNVEPVNVDAYPGRVWDWKDPQFLRVEKSKEWRGRRGSNPRPPT